MPQLEQIDTYASQVFWLALTFIPLLYIMWKVALPKVGDVLEARQQRIENDLERAAKVKDEAAELLAAYDKSLANARSEAHGILAEAARRQADAGAVEHGKLTAKLAKDLKTADTRIAKARDAAMGDIKAVAADMAQAAIAQVAGTAGTGVKDKDVAAAVAAAIKG